MEKVKGNPEFEALEVSNLYVFPFTKVKDCCVVPLIEKTLVGGGVPGLFTVVTVKV